MQKACKLGIFFWLMLVSFAQIAQAAYIDNGDTITDTVSGLEWQKATMGQVNWQEALASCEDLDLAGKLDWRLPDINELRSLVDYNRYIPSIDPVFAATQSASYWSSTTTAIFSASCIVNFYSGGSSTIDKSSARHYVRAVRGGQYGGLGSYNLVATPAAYNKIDLSWNSISGAAIYALYRDTSANGAFTAPPIYCGGNTNDVDEDGLSPNTTYYYKVVSGDATANCSSLATGWATPSDAVSATTLPLSQDKISVGNFIDMTNTHSSSDHLEIRVDLSENGALNNRLCVDGKFQIVNDVGAVVTSDEDYDCVVAASDEEHFAKYTIQFKIKKVGARSAYFEKGKLQYCPVNDTCSDIEDSPRDFSFYGTTFDVGKHAWKFDNGSWGAVKNESLVWEYQQEIRKNIFIPKKRVNFIKSVGWSNGTKDSHASKGLCYGLTNSAIATFTHQDETDSWGSGRLDTWKDEITEHWKNIATGPHRSFQQLEIGSYPWYPITAKKIMYYHVAQPFYEDAALLNWVGQDTHYIGNSVYQWVEHPELKTLLKNGNPIALSFKIEGGGGHQVAITSAILWNHHLKYMIWDNNWPQNSTGPKNVPIEKRKQVRDYAELELSNYDSKDPSKKSFEEGYSEDPSKSFEEGYSVIAIYDEASQLIGGYNLKSWETARFLDNDGDSQHIYTTGPTIPAMPLSSAIAKAIPTQKTAAQPKQTSGIIETGHIELLVVGGAVTGVFNKETGERVNLLSEGEIQTGQAVQFISLGGTMYNLYLPVDAQYRIEATKESSTPLLDIYVNIPNIDGSLTTIAYDDQTYLENSSENVFFFVGRGNSDTNIQRVSNGTTYAPSETQTIATAVGAPHYFTGLFTTENSVVLSWENPVHPNFSKVQIMRKEDSAPASPTDGTVVYEGTAQSFTDTGVTVGKYYFYSIFAVDTAAQYSEPQTIGIDTTKGNISGFVKFADGSGLANTTVSLTKITGEPVNSGITNSQGYFVISNVPFDSYIVGAAHSVNSIQEAPVSLVIPETTTVNFTAIPGALLVINKGGSGTGKVTSNPAGIDCGTECSEAYSVGTSVALAATADAGFSFAGWSGDCSGRLNPLSVTMDTNKSCIATFQQKFPWPMFLPGITQGVK